MSHNAEHPRITLVTGGREGGITYAAASQMPKDEGVIYITARKESDAIAAGHALQRKGYKGVEAAQLDVTCQADVDRVINHADSRYNGINTLLHGAVVFTPEDRTETVTRVSLSTVEEVLQVNTIGALRILRAVTPGMEAQDFGRMVFFYGSWSNLDRAFSELGGRGGAYGISKAGESYLVRSAAADFKKRGHDILVNATDPGKVDTNMNPGGLRSPREVVSDAVLLATLPKGSPITGELYRNGQSVPWHTY